MGGSACNNYHVGEDELLWPVLLSRVDRLRLRPPDLVPARRHVLPGRQGRTRHRDRLVIFALLLSGHRRALGWAMLAITFVPASDMVIVLSNDGSLGTAYGVHGLTALAVVVTAGLLLRERPLG